ncbi:uncharacterized protein CCOS01_14669, partial [Colletotrichum costaricense]
AIEEGTFFNENRNLSGELENIPFTEDHRSWVRWPSVLFTNFVLKPFETLSWALEPLMSYIAAVCLFAGWLYFMSSILPGDLLLEVFLVVLLFATVSAVVWMWDEGIIQYYLAFPDTANASAMFALTNFWFVIPRLGEWLVAPNWPLRSRPYAAVELDFQSDSWNGVTGGSKKFANNSSLGGGSRHF